MTHNEIFALGYAYGLIEVALEKKLGLLTTEEIFQYVSRNPLGAFRKIHEKALGVFALDAQTMDTLASVLDDVSSSSDFDLLNNPERDMLYFSWSKGYHRACAGKPYAQNAAEDVRKMRSDLGMTQAAFAQALGATQAEVSRWESGKVVPTEETLRKIRSLSRT